ncbi:MAG TPA: YccF domain-containing protein [Ilumatobacter sp.]
MKTIGNILWFVLAGIWLAIGYAIAGLVLCITIIGIPFGIQAFKLAGFVLWPFGRRVVAKPEALGVLDIVFNILWLLFFGWELFIAHLVAGLLLCITIIGIPFGVQSFKLSLLALWPFGQTVVPSDDPQTFA